MGLPPGHGCIHLHARQGECRSKGPRRALPATREHNYWAERRRTWEDYTRVYLSHSRESSQAIHTHSHTIRTLFAQSSHRSHSYSHTILTLFARYHTIRTLFARSHTIRTLFARSHVIRTVAHYSHTFRTVAHYSRHLHTKFAPSSHQIRRLLAPRSHYSRGGGEPVRTH